MKIGSDSNFAPRLDIGFKRYLLHLNRDLDQIVRELDFNSDYSFWFGHSIHSSSTVLSDLERAILFLEDRRFFLHHGFELRAIPRTIKRLITRRRIGGISTIDQQVVRIVTNKRKRTLARKFRETLLAWLINFHRPKRKIFDYYVHNAYLGYRIEGCEIAANKLFKKKARNLDWSEACFVAALFPYPVPKAVFLELENIPPEIDAPSVEQILSIGDRVASRWSSRVRARSQFVSGQRDFKPKSL